MPDASSAVDAMLESGVAGNLREAARAIADALPMLAKAKKVVVTSINSDSEHPANDALIQSRLVAYLCRHAIHSRNDDRTGADVTLSCAPRWRWPSLARRPDQSRRARHRPGSAPRRLTPSAEDGKYLRSASTKTRSLGLEASALPVHAHRVLVVTVTDFEFALVRVPEGFGDALR